MGVECNYTGVELQYINMPTPYLHYLCAIGYVLRLKISVPIFQ